MPSEVTNMSSPENEVKTQAENQAKLQKKLMDLAYQKAAAKNADVGFDVRGKAIFTLELGVDDWKKIAEALGVESEGLTEDLRFKEVINEKTGLEIASSVRCSLDLSERSPQSYQDNISSIKENPNYKATIVDFPQSITPFYEELLANLDHRYTSAKSFLNGAKGDEIDTESSLKVLEKQYKKAKRSIQIEVAKISVQGKETKDINTEIDNARSDALEAVKSAFYSVDEIDEQTKNTLVLLKSEAYKKHFHETAAHHHDMLGVDFSNGVVNYFSQSGDFTSHNKKTWGKGSAFRFDLKYQIGRDGKLKLYNDQAGGRVPSLANLKDDKKKDVENIKFRLTGIYEKLNKAIPDNQPAVYNLLTSLHDDYDLDDNKQNDSADRILLAAHKYNRDVKQGGYFFVQNMGVNHFTQDLNLEHQNPVIAEASLMSELSLLYTLKSNGQFSNMSESEDLYNLVLEQYQEFLSSNTDGYFYKSEQGKKARNIINEKKEKSIVPNATDNSSVKEKAAAKLAQIYKDGEHQKEEYGNLVQALSIFLERKYVSGCKSANERNEDVQKRVSTLVALDGDNYQESEKMSKLSEVLSPGEMAVEEKENIGEHTPLLNQSKNSPPTTEKLRKALAEATNETNANGSSCMISHSDQAFSSKLRSMKVSSIQGLKVPRLVMRIGATATNAISKNYKVGLAAYSLLALTFVGVALLTAFFPPAGILLGAAAFATVVGSSTAAGVLAIPPISMGLAKRLGYDTNDGCEVEMDNPRNKNAALGQSHKEKSPPDFTFNKVVSTKDFQASLIEDEPVKNQFNAFKRLGPSFKDDIAVEYVSKEERLKSLVKEEQKESIANILDDKSRAKTTDDLPSLKF